MGTKLFTSRKNPASCFIFSCSLLILPFLFLLLFSLNSYASTSAPTSTKTVSAVAPASASVSASAVASGGGTTGGGSGTITPDLFTGTLSYSIPIEVAPGRKGMSPSLALVYRSNGGNGWLGVGWDLEVGAIERSTKNGVNYSGDEYVLRIGGSTIDLVHIYTNEFGTSVTDEYRAKIESGFSRIRKLSSANGNYWEVTDRSGTKYRYGYASGSRQDDPGDTTRNILPDPNKVIKWCLDYVEDTNGNYMNLSYDKTPFNNPYEGEIYLKQIDYTGNSNADRTPTNYVHFYLEPRTDVSMMYTTKFGVKTAYRLSTIDVRTNNNPVRSYKLTYAPSVNSVRSLLVSITQYGSDGVMALPAITFEWQKGINANFALTSNPMTPGYINNGTGIYFGDWNGDGITDMMWYNQSTGDQGWFVNDGKMGFTRTSNPIPAGYINNGTGIYFGDWNGDGITDMVWYNQSTGDQQWLTGSGKRDLLTSISNGLGATTTIEYKPSTQYPIPQPQLPFPIQTVYSIKTNDGNGNVVTTTYDYQGGYYHIGERDFRGFNHVTVTGPDDNGKRTVTETWFHQGNDTAVDVNDPSGPDGYMKGKPYRTRVKDEQGRIYSETTTVYLSGASAPYFNPPIQMDGYSCEGVLVSCANDASARHTQTIITQNYIGNVTREDHYGDFSDGNDDYTVVRSFSPNSDKWILGLPDRESIYKGIGTAGNPVSSTSFYYDEPVDCTFAALTPVVQPPTKGNPTRIVRTLDGGTNPEVRMAYDPYGNLSCTKDANGNKSSLTYDSSFTFPKVATNALGYQATTQYYGVDGVQADKGLYGQVKSATDANLTVNTMEYDTFGRKVKVIAPDGSWAASAYNDFGTIGLQNVQTTTSAGTSSWTYFDGFGRTTTSKSKGGPDGRVIVANTEYNSNGTVKRSSQPYFDGTSSANIKWKRFVYDSLGRVTQVYNVDDTWALSCYDKGVTVAVGVMSATQTTGHRKRETKNAQGKLVKVEEYDGPYTSCTTEQGSPYATTTYAYDVLGNLLKVTDTYGNETRMAYDTLGRKKSMHDPDMGDWTYTYDPNGNLKTQKAANLQTITFFYDELNRITKKDYPTGTDVNYYYGTDPVAFNVGRLITMTDAAGTTQYTYDILGRSKSSTKTVDATPYTMVTDYDQAGRIKTISYPQNSGTVTYNYDADGHLWTVTGTGETMPYAQYSGYNALGQPKDIMYGNGVTTTYDYDPSNNLLKNILTNSPVEGAVLNLTYTFDNNGNITNMADGINAARSQTFVYDAINRLKEAHSASYGDLSYDYDKIGNITSKEGVGYTYSKIAAGPHAVTSTNDGKTYTYDANGNMINDSQRAIVYDYDNMPQSVTSNSTTTSFVYDGGGARVKKVTSTNTTVYIGKLYECNGSACSKYIFAGGTRIALKTSTDTLYYHQDHLGSSRIVTNKDGNKVEEAHYLPFGAAKSDTGTVSVNHKYTSQEFDAETGLYYYNARYYNPVLGRFISPDGIVPNPWNPQELNRYSYVNNNPTNLTDPTGHRSWRKLFRAAAWVLNPAWGASVDVVNSHAFQQTMRIAGDTADKALRYGFYDLQWKLLDRESYDRYGRTVRAIEFASAMQALGVPAPLAGATNGALLAARSGGDISTGILAGGLSSAIPAVSPFGSGAIASFGNQIVTDAIRGAATGGVLASMNGRDIWSGAVRGGASSAIAGQVNNAIGHIVGLATSGALPRYDQTHDVFIYEGVSSGAITFGNVIVGDHASILAHEYIHTFQYGMLGLAFLPAYVAQFPAAIATLHNPFTFNVLEYDARQQSGQGY